MRVLAATVLALALAGCASRIEGPLSPSFGSAVASMDAQIIDPTPAKGPPSTSAAKAALAIERYEQDRVKDPAGADSEENRGGAGDQQGSGQGGDDATAPEK